MGAVFKAVEPIILALEGGEEDNKSDYGGLTKFGISQKQYPNMDIASLTDAQALMILEQDYWNHYNLSVLNDQPIANQCFFLLVNMDPHHAAEIIQKAINACGRGIIAVDVDGIFGIGTLKALNSIAQYWLGDRIRLEAIRYYLSLADNDPVERVNLRGWVRRALT